MDIGKIDAVAYWEVENVETNLERIIHDIEKINEYNSDLNNGYTRFSYTKEDKLAKEYIISEMKKVGLDVIIDAIGNIRGRYRGSDKNAPAIMTGSHIDTVEHGGRFDGIVGVVAGLEVVRVLSENNINLTNPVEVVVFVEEEGCNFGSPMAGSKGMTGKFNVEDYKRMHNDKGLSMYEAAKNFGLNPDSIEKYVLKAKDVKAMIEMHVEQSSVLDSEGIPIGIVKAIAGVKRYGVEFTGVANHAGATPMNLRRDPMAAASKVISSIDNIIKEKAYCSTVGTVGKIVCYPNVLNVIPEKVYFTIDIRDVTKDGVDITAQEIERKVNEVSKLYNVTAKMELTGEGEGITLSNKVIKVIESSAKRRNIRYKMMNSGAGHDACMLGDITDVGMIFVPSINGRSHVPEEMTDYKDIKLGCDILLDTIIDLAK